MGSTLTVAITLATRPTGATGWASARQLADRVTVGVTPTSPSFVSPFALRAPGGRLKEDAIMVGPGTGIAPSGRSCKTGPRRRRRGRNWLFFGDQKGPRISSTREGLGQVDKGRVLTRMDTAFSRDQLDKIYVQDRMRENAAELWAWIKGRAQFLRVGDAKRMAKDVEVALHDVIAGQGGMAPAQAADYVKLMKKEKRYQRDVY